MDIYTLNTKFLATIEQMTIHIDNCNDLELQMGDAFFEVVQSLYGVERREMETYW